MKAKVKICGVFLILVILASHYSWGRVVFRSVMYSDFSVPGPSSFNIDFNQDGVIDIVMSLKSDGVPPASGSTLCGFPPPSPYPGIEGSSSSIGINQLFAGGGYFAGTGSPLITNTLIGDNLTYSTTLGGNILRDEWKRFVWNYNPVNNCYNSYSTSPYGERMSLTGIWSNPVTFSGYLGVRFSINGKFHYGYLKIEESGAVGPTEYRITEIGYESIPGYPIKAGDRTGFFSDIFNPTANIIRGKVYNDSNGNCAYDAGELVIPNLLVYSASTNHGAMTDENGNYEIYVAGGTGSYILDIDTTPLRGLTFHKSCVTTRTVSFTGNNQTSLQNNFMLQGSACSRLKVEIASNRRRRCFRNSTFVTYSNASFTSSDPATKVAVVMPAYVKAISSSPAWTSQSGDTLFYNVGVVGPFTKNYINIIDSVICGDESIRGLTQCTQAFITPKNYCDPDNSWDQSDLILNGSCSNSVFSAAISNFGQNMIDSVSYRIFLDGTLVKTKRIKLNAAGSLSLTLPTDGKALRIEVDQHPLHPQVSLRSLNYEGCGNLSTSSVTKGFATNYPVNENSFMEAVSCQIIRDSYDPNDKQAVPSGVGNDHRILANGDIEYTIRFQNTGNDEAYTVVIADTLDASFDVGSFETIAASHSYKLEMTGKTSPRLVWIFGGINLPASSVNEPASHGFVTYRVSQKKNLSTGTILNNKAYIFFDYNSAIITNNVNHKIGLAYSVDTLKAVSQTATQQLCENTSFSVASATNGFGTLQYQWYKDGSLLSSQTSSSLSISNALVADGGSYRCRVDNKIDTIYTSPVAVSINVTPSLAITDPNASCTSVNITNAYIDNNSATGTVSYWKDANATITLATPAAVTEAGTYYIKKETSQGCQDIEEVEVTLFASPELSITDPQPVCNATVDITGTYADDNATTGTVSYWTNAEATALLSNPSAVANSGTYYIKKETSNGCTDIASVEVEINNCTNTLDELLSNLGVKIYPNPVVEKVVIDNQTALKVSLTDSQGKELYNSIVEGGENAIDMKTLPSGIYALVLEQNGRRYMTKLVKK